jgi:hypothetical protein
MKYALITGTSDQIRPYLPGNYDVLVERDIPNVGTVTLIGGQDTSWTMEHYVLPRLASGNYFAREISVTGAVNFKNGSCLERCA